MNSEYTQDVAFNSDFGALQTPVHLATAALLSGWDAAKYSGHFRYLDLACGNGHTLTLLADAYPDAEFVGLDINPVHIEQGQTLAREGKLDNLTFICTDIADASALNLTGFDYCTASGVYSWLDENRQAALFDVANHALAQGGLFFLDYCALPGITQNATLYGMLQQLSSEYSGSSAEKLKGASQLLAEVKSNNGQFFQQNSQANERFDRLLANPPEDEAHEVLNLQARSVWSRDIIAKAEDVGLAFVGSAGLHHNLEEFSAHLGLPKNSQQFSTATRQMLQDIAWNVAQRKDIYCKGCKPSTTSILQRVGDCHFYFAPGALSDAVIKGITAQFPAASLLTPSIISLLRQHKHCSTINELVAHFCQQYQQKTGHDFLEKEKLINQLLATRVMSLANPVEAPLQQGSLYMPSVLNQTLLKQDIHLEHGRPLASPVIGTRLLLPIKDRLYLWALVFGDVGSAWDQMSDLRNAFHDANGQPIDKQMFVSIITQSQPAFNQRVVPELVRLGILQYR
ncbi:class I SAM-dependent methyltransferase [Aliiglaciecola sp. 3_MG-2023]|uniref:class I SAM-dependent methyltransferase n=1 Tax=Aliiglaciecola sp. 3_MG-2023 TaxID=3062644 RepID=UPI0026E338D9|nr:class I SAM-dependent methyltransferase [Aliiglaciecola sp. 3_MG-2023]MDO6695441.1 class I SAM-dependent methyltransferase [Aliiglaciecola sp. 3_MG-2023]